MKEELIRAEFEKIMSRDYHVLEEAFELDSCGRYSEEFYIYDELNLNDMFAFFEKAYLSASAPLLERIARMQLVIDAACEWSCDREVRDWGDAELLKALWTFDGDRKEPCEGCDGKCEESCAPCTVADAHGAIDAVCDRLVKEGKLFKGTALQHKEQT